MKKLLIILTGSLLCLVFLTTRVEAVTVTLSNSPTSITDQSYSFNVSVSGAQAGTNYLRADLFLTGTTNYFGYTFNGSSFYTGSVYSSYLPITIDSSGNWDGTVQGKLDTSSNYYSGPGTYSLKARRYTQSGSSYTWSNEVTLAVSLPTPTPTPQATAQPTTSSTPTPAPTALVISVSGVPNSLNSSDQMNLSVSMNSFEANTKYFIKGAFKKAGSSNYFGLTSVSGAWIKNADSYYNQLPITTDTQGNWSGNLIIKADVDDSGFVGSGDYIFKVGYYKDSSVSWGDDYQIFINQNSTPTTTTAPNTTVAGNSFTGFSSSKPVFRLLPENILGASATATASAVPSSYQPSKVSDSKIFGKVALVLGGALIFSAFFVVYYYFKHR